MAATNVFQNTSLVTNEFMFQLKNAMPFYRGCNNDYAGRFTENMKAGESIKVRKPPVYTARTGETFSAGNIVDQYCTMTVQDTAGVDLEITNREQMFNFTSLREQVIKPAALTLANTIELAAISKATLATYNFVGVPGTIPTSLETYNQARAIQFNNSAPQDGRDRLVITADMGVKTNTAGLALFNPGQQLSKSFEQGYITRHAGADVMESQNVLSLTTGAYGGTPAFGAVADGTADDTSVISTTGWTAAAAARLRAGDIIQIAGVYEVNRITKQSTGRLKSFVVQANFSSLADGSGDVTVSPRLVSAAGPTQNVSAAPAGGALISIYGKAAADQAAIASLASPQGLRYHRNAFLVASFDQPTPQGGVIRSKMISDNETGLRIRFIEDWDTNNNKALYRFDLVWAFGVAYPEIACRVSS